MEDNFKPFSDRLLSVDKVNGKIKLNEKLKLERITRSLHGDFKMEIIKIVCVPPVALAN